MVLVEMDPKLATVSLMDWTAMLARALQPMGKPLDSLTLTVRLLGESSLVQAT
jgi:hypothetical protein